MPNQPDRPAPHGHEKPAPQTPGKYVWRIGYSLAEFQHADLMVETEERTFTAAEVAAEEQHATLHQTWPGPVEIMSIEYLGER